MDLLDFSSDFLFPSNNGDELVIHQPVALTTSTEQSQENEYQQVASSRTRVNEPTGFSTGTNQTIPQLATHNSYPWNSNWITNTNTTSASNLQEEPQTDLLSSTSNNNMFQELQPHQFQELSRNIEEVLPIDLSEINVSDISIESTVPPSQPSSFSISHELNMALEQTPSSTIAYATTPAYSTAFVNPGMISNNSEQSSSQNQLFTQSYSGFVPSNLRNSAPQQSSFAPIINYNEQQTVNNYVTPSTSGYTPSSSTQQTLPNRNHLYSRGTRTQHSLVRANVIPGSDIHSSRLAGSHDGPTQSVFHPYNTTGQQQQNSPHSLSRNRRLKHFQNSVAMNSRGFTNQGFLNTYSPSSDSANYYQRNVHPQTINPPSSAAAIDFRQQFDQNRLVFNRPVNSSESVAASLNSGFESTSVGYSSAIRIREAPSSVNNSSEDTSIFLPFSQAEQNAGCNIRRQNVKSNDSTDRGPKFSAALQVTAARQLLVQAAASAAAAGDTAFSQSLTEKTQNLERLIQSFCPAFLIGGRSQMKAFLSLTSSASTQSSPPRIPRCSVCLDKLISTILFPCRHFICETCAPKIDKCGLCRKIIEDRHRVFF